MEEMETEQRQRWRSFLSNFALVVALLMLDFRAWLHLRHYLKKVSLTESPTRDDKRWRINHQTKNTITYIMLQRCNKLWCGWCWRTWPCIQLQHQMKGHNHANNRTGSDGTGWKLPLPLWQLMMSLYPQQAAKWLETQATIWGIFGIFWLFCVILITFALSCKMKETTTMEVIMMMTMMITTRMTSLVMATWMEERMVNRQSFAKCSLKNYPLPHLWK